MLPYNGYFGKPGSEFLNFFQNSAFSAFKKSTS